MSLTKGTLYKTGEISIGIDRAESEGYFLSEGQEGVTESELEQSGFREVGL